MTLSLAPSELALVPFVSVDDMMKIVNDIGPAQAIADIADYIEADFRRWESFDKTPRVAAHSREGVIELMPTSDGNLYGFKYVNCHPGNMKKGLQTVTGFGLLSRVVTGSGVPPAAGIRISGPLQICWNTIVPSAFQVPPRPLFASQSGTTGPPRASILLSFPPVKKPIQRPSGDQNG